MHLLLEKPPAPSYAEFRRMADGVAEAGVVCQIGFQSLGSHALPADPRADRRRARSATLVGLGGAGAWVARRGVLPAGALGGQAAAERRRRDRRGADQPARARRRHRPRARPAAPRAEDVTGIETELLRANDIESDDTSCVRVTTTQGLPVTVAATLCAEEPDEPYVLVHGDRGRITFWYKQDRVLLQRAGHGPEEYEHGRTDLLENLVDHLTDGADLLVPPDATGAFMKVVEAIRTGPRPGAAARHRLAPDPRRATAGWCPASTDSSRPPPTPSPSTPSSAPPGPCRGAPANEVST